MFSADLTIVFVLVTVLSVSCSFGGSSVQVQRPEEGEFWVPTCVESFMEWPSSYEMRHMDANSSPASSTVQIPCYIVGAKNEKEICKFEERAHVWWYGRCAESGPLIGCFSANHGHVKGDSVNNFQYDVHRYWFIINLGLKIHQHSTCRTKKSFYK